MTTFRSRGENLRSIYVLLFLHVAFFFLEYEDPRRFAALFAFDGPSVRAGQLWRLVSYQFTQAGQGWFFFPKPLVLFFSLLLLYIMGSAVEEEWGTRHFLVFFTLSALGSAGIAALLGVPLLGSFFLNFSLLFVYASIYPEQTFFLFAVIPVRVRWLAYVAVALLVLGVAFGPRSNVAALGGAALSYAYFILQHQRPHGRSVTPPPSPLQKPEQTSILNAARFVAIKRAVAARAPEEIDRLAALAEREVVKGVNICPPADYKPENRDGYCIRCEGFAECSVRYLKAARPVTEAVVTADS